MQKLSRFLVRVVERYLPDPLLFAIILTIVVFIMGIGITKCTPMEMVIFWGDGFWSLLAFAMQMVLVLVTGHTLATSPPFEKLIKKIATSIKGHAHAIILTSFVAALGSWINWGFGLVIGALLAKEIAKKIRVLTIDCLLQVPTPDSSYGTQVYQAPHLCRLQQRGIS